MQEVDCTLRHFVETEIIPRYAAFDKAHQIDHAETVQLIATAVLFSIHL